MIEITKYTNNNKAEWNEFISNSKNGVFLFYRDFMDYHSDRFQDYSLMFYKENDLVALLPANILGNTIQSHAGLTFGGLVTNKKISTVLTLEIFEELKVFFKKHTINKLIYKQIPYIFHLFPAEEDVYALYRNNARILKQEASSLIYLQDKIKFSKGKKCGISKAKKACLEVQESKDYQSFFEIEKELLQKKHKTKPVHTAEEMEMLSGNFPENIKLFGVFKNNKMLAGSIIFKNNQTVHTQYIGSDDEGKELGALDYLMDYLINSYYANEKYFDFGISTENKGLHLNEGLIAQKEMFGGRTIIYNTYEMDI